MAKELILGLILVSLVQIWALKMFYVDFTSTSS